MSGCIQEKRTRCDRGAYRGEGEVNDWFNGTADLFGPIESPSPASRERAIIQLTNIATDVILADQTISVTETKERIKDAARARGITYDGVMIAQALDAAEWHRYGSLATRRSR